MHFACGTLILLASTAAPTPQLGEGNDYLNAYLRQAQSKSSQKECVDSHNEAQCKAWAAAGECEKNAGFMRRSCAKSCDSCGWEDTYCTDRANGDPAKSKPGDITATFQQAISFTEFEPTVHSSPATGGPWVVTFDRFISDEEADAFITTTDHHFKRSLAGDQISPVRTSQQAWCQHGIAPDCVDHPLVNRVHERVVNLTGVPKPNAEFFQVLRYEPGQFYKTHHDQNTDPQSLAGVRLFTFFIYLQTPDAGGQTYFPTLNISIEPKRGAALMWPNVRDEDLHLSDMRTEHEAKPPSQGLKFSANLWLHQYDFRGPNMHGCDMAKRVQRKPVVDAQELHVEL